MKIWIDDVRIAPAGYTWCKSTNEAIQTIDENRDIIELVDIDHDAGDYCTDGGDYIRVLDWLEIEGLCYPVRIHSMNPVGVGNMRAIIQKNGWKEIR